MIPDIGTCLCGEPCDFLYCDACYEEALEIEDSEFDDEQFCATCFAGTESSEHFEKCGSE